MAGSSSFPTSVDNYTEVQDGIDVIQADDVNDSYKAHNTTQTLIGATGKSQVNNIDILNYIRKLFNSDTKMRIEYTSATTITVKAGVVFCAKSDNSLRVMRENTGDTAVTFADIDTGAEAANTRYYIIAVADATATTVTFKISLSSTAPTGVTTFKVLGSFVNDGSSNIVKGSVKQFDEDESGGIRTGMMMPWPSATPPDGFLKCDGSSYDDTLYADLFAVIGTTYGGSSPNFNVPDLRGRAIIGLDNMGGSSADRVVAAAADSLGGTMGAETHTLTESEMPAHTHTISSVNNNGGAGVTNIAVEGQVSANDSFVTQSKGGGAAHNIMQPSMAMNWIIKT